MASEYAIEAEGLSKAYRQYNRPLDRILEAGSLGRWKRHQEFWALKDISFQLRPGSSLGLCGSNGAGKSTLLKILAGTTAPTQGRYRLNGRVASLLELGAGFHQDFTGRSNIFMNGVMMGFSVAEMEAKVDEIIDFAELGNFIDEPVRTYSSGMGLRLGFAIAVAVDPEVLIIDEVFAVGDMYFQKKCIDKIYEFKQKNKTILFCSHSLYDVRQLCDQAIWLKHGEAQAIGDSVVVTNEYAAFQHDNIGSDGDGVEEAVAAVGGEAVIQDRPLPKVLDARLCKAGTLEEAYEVATGDDLELRIWWENPDPEATPANLGVIFLRSDQTIVVGMGTHLSNVALEGHSGCSILSLPKLPLLSGVYQVPILLMDQGGVHRYQQYILPNSVTVRNPERDVGLVRIPFEWRQDDLATPDERWREAQAAAALEADAAAQADGESGAGD